MKKSRWLTTCLALSLAGLLAWSVPVMAQGRGGGGPQGQGNQWCMGGGPGPNPGRAYCPNYPGYRNSPGYRGDTTQAPRGRRLRGGGPYNQPSTQIMPPAVTQ